jgi:hypothetical protein
VTKLEILRIGTKLEILRIGTKLEILSMLKTKLMSYRIQIDHGY